MDNYKEMTTEGLEAERARFDDEQRELNRILAKIRSDFISALDISGARPEQSVSAVEYLNEVINETFARHRGWLVGQIVQINSALQARGLYE